MDLDRFVVAQQEVYPAALAELRAGRKRTHWMWFMFPQLAGLGQSSVARFYAIQDLDEAGAYLHHPVLGPRLVEVATALLTQPNRDASQIFGDPDNLKLRSSLTLFALVPAAPPVFRAALDAFFDGPDAATLGLLNLPGTGVAER
ncbi:MAG: DUF1810 domain-containing protein [Propionibacteriaceae bacterium]|jgi:uncharacterized protein (DUF1810 family)|nr:DUF1810 domain-containing protein [Propionibacteriaceae bacterium]